MSEVPGKSRPAEVSRVLRHGDRDRWYTVHVPSNYDAARPWPCVFAIHGATSNPRLMERFSGLSDFADREGFLVVYPAGTGNLPNVLTWNGGDCCGHAVQHQVDDVGYFAALLEDLSHVVSIDPRRLFLAGMSNGAHMAYRLAATMGDRFAAVACVAGPMAMALGPIRRPIPVLHMHGTDDEFAPFRGGQGPRSVYGASLPSVDETIAFWRKANGCAGTPRIEWFDDVAGDGTRIERRTYGPCNEGVEVVLYVVHGGGHTWPGRPPLPLSLGKSTANLDANAVMWEFFQRHTLPTTWAVS